MKDYQKKSDNYRKQDNSSSTLIYVICGAVLVVTLLWYYKSHNKNVEPVEPQEEVVDEQCAEDAEEWDVAVCEVEPAYLETDGYEVDEACEAEDDSTSNTSTNMDILYVGVANPVEIKAPNVSPENLEVMISGHASITKKSDNNYIVKVSSVGKVTINVFANIDGQYKNIMSKNYKVIRLPEK